MNYSCSSLIDTIRQSTSPFHVVASKKEWLLNQGFEELKLSEDFVVEKGKGYVLEVYGSSFVAFTVGQNYQKGDGVRIACAHTDSPGFSIKGKPDIIAGGYQKLNIEVYGGPIIPTWLDRPLSIAGCVTIRGNDIFHPQIRLIDFKRPMLTIPNLAPHLNKEAKSKEMNRQLELQPIYALVEAYAKKKEFLTILAEEMSVTEDDILDFELYLYVYENACCLGVSEELFSGPRLDNITSVEAAVTAICQGRRERGINVIVGYDHEEVGSKTKKGAASVLLTMILKKIYIALNNERSGWEDSLLKSHCLSVDVAHAFHPNYTDKSDLTNQVILGQGIVIKTACSQSYASDSEMAGIIIELCRQNGIPYQRFYNRSDLIGGSTLGAIMNTLLPMPVQDVGIPVLAMHSARELMGSNDQKALNDLLTVFMGTN